MMKMITISTGLQSYFWDPVLDWPHSLMLVDPKELNLSRNHNILNAKEKSNQMQRLREARDAQGTHQASEHSANSQCQIRFENDSEHTIKYSDQSYKPKLK